MVSENRNSRQVVFCSSALQDQTSVVVESLQSLGRNSIVFSEGRPQAFYSCLSKGLGRSGRVAGVSGSLVWVSTPHQCPGDLHSQENSPSSFSSSGFQFVSSDTLFHTSRIHKQGGGEPGLGFSWRKQSFCFSYLSEKFWTLKAIYIPGRFNVIVDQLSRLGQVLPTEWSLCP